MSLQIWAFVNHAWMERITVFHFQKLVQANQPKCNVCGKSQAKITWWSWILCHIYWAGDLDDCKSRSRYLFKLSGAAISWRNKKQTCVALSTAAWMQCLQYNLNKVHVCPTIIYEDTQSMICIVKNSLYHGWAKHIDIKFHYIQEQVVIKTIEQQYCQSKNTIADMLTKGLTSIQFVKLRELLGLWKITE